MGPSCSRHYVVFSCVYLCRLMLLHSKWWSVSRTVSVSRTPSALLLYNSVRGRRALCCKCSDVLRQHQLKNAWHYNDIDLIMCSCMHVCLRVDMCMWVYLSGFHLLGGGGLITDLTSPPSQRFSRWNPGGVYLSMCVSVCTACAVVCMYSRPQLSWKKFFFVKSLGFRLCMCMCTFVHNMYLSVYYSRSRSSRHK